MPLFEIPFGEWLPSQPDFKNPGCVIADNVIPTPSGYGPVRALVDQSQSAASQVFGAVQMFDNSGSSLIVGGVDDGLFVRRSSITSTGSLTSIGAGEAWDFAQFNDFVFATAVNNSPQYLTDIDSDNTWSAAPGSPPNAKRCAKVGDFLMMGNLPASPSGIQWSSINSPATSWTASRQTQAGGATLPTEYGEIQKIVGGRYATIFQKRGIMRLSYVGPPTVWRTDVISQDRGALAPFSVATVGYFSYFLAQDGFYITNGASVQPIGSQRVNRWFFDTAHQANLGRVQAAIDWQNEAIVWSFMSSENDVYDRQIIYSWSEQRWSTATIATQWIVGSNLDGTDLDSLDAIYGDLDQIPVSLDDISFRPGERTLAAFADSGGSSNYHTFTGSPIVATWQTGEAQPAPSQRVFVSEVHPLIEADTWDMKSSLYMRDNCGVQTTSNEITTGWGGFSAVRGEGQKVAVRLSKPAGTEWSHAQGVQVRFRGAGNR